MEAWSGLNQDCLSERFSASARDGAWCFYLAGSGAQLPLKEDDEHSFQTASRQTQRKLKGNSKEVIIPFMAEKKEKRMTWKLISDHQTFHALILPLFETSVYQSRLIGFSQSWVSRICYAFLGKRGGALGASAETASKGQTKWRQSIFVLSQ